MSCAHLHNDPSSLSTLASIYKDKQTHAHAHRVAIPVIISFPNSHSTIGKQAQLE